LLDKKQSTEPFAFFFKGVREFKFKNYLLAIENLQNCSKFHDL